VARSVVLMRFRLKRPRVVISTLLALVVVAGGISTWLYAVAAASPEVLEGPSQAGLNYGMPHTIDGQWVGTEWLRSRSIGGSWEDTQPALAADLDFIQQHHLGRVIRLFVGLDQAMVWNDHEGFDGFDEPTLQHFSQALDMLDARGIEAVVVIFDQEVVASRGNFHTEALDGNHAAMRRHYLAALGEFMQRFGARKTVIGWDLFNEAYNSLGRDGHLPPPPHADPISPNYSDQTVHQWLSDLYRTARQAAPEARFTVSDSTELYWNPNPDLAKYQDVVDFYDIHVYDDNPRYPNWRWLLHKPYIVGEAGASSVNQHYEDQALNSKAVTYLLDHSQSAGVSFVLVQGAAFSPSRDSLTPTGAVVAGFLSRHPGAGGQSAQDVNPVDVVVGALVSAARRVRGWFTS
jgi:cellulase (glycosyl hydrolase family 5)